MKDYDLSLPNEGRASSALEIKDEQLRIPNEQNAHLTGFNQSEEAANEIRLEKLTVEDENRCLHDNYFIALSKFKVAVAELEKAKEESTEKDNQLQVLTAQNAELLRLLEVEEAHTCTLQTLNEKHRSELGILGTRYATLLTMAKTYEDAAQHSASDSQVRVDELRILRKQVEQLSSQKHEITLKSQVEIDTLHEQLRLQKTKLYQLLTRLRAHEDAKLQVVDQVTNLETKLRESHARGFELDSQLRAEISIRQSQENKSRILTARVNNLTSEAKAARVYAISVEKDRLRMEAESRDTSVQLREMAEKVFQLLERLKLAELGKRRQEDELSRLEVALKSTAQKNDQLLKEMIAIGKARARCELDVKVLQNQLWALKDHNRNLAQRCQTEVRTRVIAAEERDHAIEKVNEESKMAYVKEMFDLKTRFTELKDHAARIQQFADNLTVSNHTMAHALRLKEEELSALQSRKQLVRKRETARCDRDGQCAAVQPGPSKNALLSKPQSDTVCTKVQEGKLYFHTEQKALSSAILLKGATKQSQRWLEQLGVNNLLRQAQASTEVRKMLVDQVNVCCSLLYTKHEEISCLEARITDMVRETQICSRKVTLLQEQMLAADETKRRVMMRYIRSLTQMADAREFGNPVPRAHHAEPSAILLPSCSVGDEEVRALAALLKGNKSITELCLHSNFVTDAGAATLANILEHTQVRYLDVRRNFLTGAGRRCLVEALERCEGTGHVYVHAGGKIEAFGSEPRSQHGPGGLQITIIRTVDCRENPVRAGVADVDYKLAVASPITAKSLVSDQTPASPPKA